MAIRVSLEPGDKLIINLHGADGEFIVEYGDEALTINTEWPDTDGRTGEIYREEYGRNIHANSDGIAGIDDTDERDLVDEEHDEDIDDGNDGKEPMERSAFLAKLLRVQTNKELVSFDPKSMDSLCQVCGARVPNIHFYLRSNKAIQWNSMVVHFAEIHGSALDIELVEAIEALVE